MGNHQPSATLSRFSPASPEVVYDLLATLRSHLEWGGSEQRSDFRLLTMDAPDGPAAVGTVFVTTGSIPMSGRRWEDRSTVTVAVRPTTFEFVTEARAGAEPRAMTARFVNRYELARHGAGCQVTYTQTQLEVANPMLRLALPGIRDMMWRVGIPMFESRGFRNLLHQAETLTAVGVNAATVGAGRVAGV